jgi:protease I
MKEKRIAMLLGPGYEDLEFWAVYMRMKETGASIITVGLHADEVYKSKHGCLEARAEYSADQVNPDDVDAVLVPGGWAPDAIRRDPYICSLVKKVHEQGKIVGMICHAGLVGISAGIVSGVRATGSLGIKDDLVNAGATWTDEPAFRDGSIVWGRVVADIPDYNRELVKALS